MKKVKFTDLYELIHDKSAILKRVNYLIKKSQFIGGKEVLNFENNFSKYVNSKYCISVANGTDALEIAIASLKFKKRVRNHFAGKYLDINSRSNCYKRMQNSFCDVNLDDYSICLKDLKKSCQIKQKQ